MGASRRKATRLIAAVAAWIAVPALADSTPTDALAAVDLHRTAIIADIVKASQSQDPAKLADTARLKARLEALRADKLLAASLTSSPESLEAILAHAEKPLTDSALAGRFTPKVLGASSTDLVYTPLTPCRLIDTRGFGAPIQGGAFTPNARRAYTPNGLCGLPTSGVASILISFTTENLTPNSGGYLAILAPAAPVTTSVDIFNLGSEWSASNTAVATGSAAQFDVFVNTAFAHVVIDVLGYFAAPQGGAVTSITAGPGLTGGTITSTGTIGLAATNLLPATPCATNQIAKWTGSAWGCAADATSAGTVTGVTASTPLASSGGSAPNISLTGAIPVANGGTGQITLGNGVLIGQGTAGVMTAAGFPGQIFAGTSGVPAGTAGVPAWTGSPSISGSLTLLTPSTASAGNIMKGANRFIHDSGSANTFAGLSAGNFTLTGTDNVGLGTNALTALTTGGNNVASGSGALASLTTGSGNVAVGLSALANSIAGSANTAVGNGAYANSSNGSFNVMVGSGAGLGSTMGDVNTIVGTNAFGNSTTGGQNTGVGGSVLGAVTTGNGNTALGNAAGSNITTGNFNISLGNPGVAAETGAIRIGNFLQTKAFIAGIRGVTTTNPDAVAVVIDSNGQLGTSPAPSSGGTVTSVGTGSGLTGGPITATGTIALAATNLLPTSACATNQIAKWNGSAWACAADANSGGTVTGVTATAPLASSGGSAPDISLAGAIPVANGGTGQTSLAANGIVYGQGTAAVSTAVGADGQVLAGSAGAPAWTGSPSISGNLTLVNPSTASAGTIMKGAFRFIHSFGSQNTFIGLNAGNFTMSGSGNTASGQQALANNGVGSSNTANGVNALSQNNTGSNNAASGYYALYSNSSGSGNTASGDSALSSNQTGNYNTANGTNALVVNTTGSSNTAIGSYALYNHTTGSNTIAIGRNAGLNLTTGDFNIDIGNAGVAAEGNTMRIGDVNQTRTFIAGIRGVTTGSATAIAVLIDSNGQLGTISSSRRFKDDIADMDAASSPLMNLRPVTFHYKTDRDPSGRTLQYGLIAEEVATVYPELVAHSADGQVETVMYQFLPPMLLNEVQKQKRRIDAQATHIAGLELELEKMKEQMARVVRMLDR